LVAEDLQPRIAGTIFLERRAGFVGLPAIQLDDQTL
jgi:hypothetical protein